jgi:hypothetical protein
MPQSVIEWAGFSGFYDKAPRLSNTWTLCQIYSVTLSPLPRFGCVTRPSGAFQMGRVPGVLSGNRHTCLMVSLKEAVPKHSVRETAGNDLPGLWVPRAASPPVKALHDCGCHGRLVRPWEVFTICLN